MLHFFLKFYFLFQIFYIFSKTFSYVYYFIYFNIFFKSHLIKFIYFFFQTLCSWRGLNLYCFFQYWQRANQQNKWIKNIYKYCINEVIGLCIVCGTQFQYQIHKQNTSHNTHTTQYKQQNEVSCICRIVWCFAKKKTHTYI